MRILHVITSLQTGGAEHLMVDLLPRMASNDDTTVDLLVFSGERTPFMDELESQGITIYKLTSGGGVYNPSNIVKMMRYLGNYDIIHTHNTATQVYVPLSCLFLHSKVKLVTTEHGIKSKRRSLWWFKPIDRWVYNQYAAIACIADQSRSIFEQYIGKKDNIYTIYNGIDVQRFVRPIRSVEGKDHFIITMVAAFRQEKDHGTVLRAMSLLPENYRLQLVGDGVEKDAIHSLAISLGLEKRVSFLGVRQDVPDILEQSDVAVLSSHWEGFGLAAVEAMAACRPVVASDVGGLRNVVGGAGLLFPHGDEKELAEKIQWLCEHPDEYREVAERCQEKARQYDISVTADKYLELYEKLLNKSSK